MMNYYNLWSSGDPARLQDGVRHAAESPPKNSKFKRTWLLTLLSFATFFLGYEGFAQVGYNQNFDVDATGWTGGARSTANSCAGNSYRSNVYSGVNATKNYITPLLGVSNGTVHTISFDYKITKYSPAGTAQDNPWGTALIQYGATATGPWTTIGTIDNANHTPSAACVNKQYTFTPVNGSNVFVRYNITWSAGDYYFAIDNFSVNGIVNSAPSCATGQLPANLASNIQRNPTLSWTAPSSGAPSSYDVFFGTTSNPSLVANVTTTSYKPSGLLPNTTYYWKVVPKNSLGSATGCIERSFTTNSTIVYCQPYTEYGCTDGDVIARVILNTLDNTSGTGCPSGDLGYSDFSNNPALTTSLQAGGQYNLTVYAGQYTEGYAAWIDYNDDGLFSESERIGYSNGKVAGSGSVGQLGSSATFPITLSCAPALGAHRLRVRGMYNINGIDVLACVDNSFGETEDYTITITAAVACPQPSLLVASNVSSSSATLGWTIGCAETAWEVFVQAAGAGVPTGSGVAVTSNSYVATGFATISEFYVRANCGGGSFSLWSGPYIFTPPACPVLLSPINGATEVGAGIVTLDWEDTAGAISYDVYWGTSANALTLLGNTPNSIVNITGVTQTTTFFWSIVAVNVNGVSTGCTPFSFTTAILPGDDCATAISLDNLTSPITGNTADFTDQFTPTCNTSNTAGDVFYSITVPENYTLVIGQPENNFDSVHSILYGTCASATQILCTDGNENTNTTWVNTTGIAQTVYFIMDGWSAYTGTFTLAWTLTPPPIGITGVSPATICSNEVGSSVITLTGTNFANATSVELNGVATPFTVINDTTIQVALTANSTAGTFTVYNSVTSATTATALTITTSPYLSEITGGTSLCSGTTSQLQVAELGGSWSSSNESVATVDPNGLVSAVSGGSATITYSATDNNCTSSLSVEVTVAPAIISTNPTDAVAADGSVAQFSVTASNATSYQWRISTDYGLTHVNLSNDATYSGVTTNTLMVNATSSLNNAFYSVVVGGQSPCGTFTSSDATLTVGTVGISQQPVNANLCEGGDGVATFSIQTTGPTPEISWEIGGLFGFDPIQDGAYDNVTFSGTNTNTLTITGVDVSNSGWVFRAAINEGDAYSNTVVLNVNQTPVFTSEPTASPICYSGGSTTFDVIASGTVESYQWQFSTDGTSFTDVTNGLPLGVSYSGMNSANLSVTTSASTSTSGSYYYRAIAIGASPCGSTTSSATQLMFYTPSFTQQPSATSVTAGLSASFSVASAAPSPTYQWQYSPNGTSGWINVANQTPTGYTYTGANSATLNVATSASATAGTRYYRAILTTNQCVVASNSAALSVVTYCVPSATVSTSYLNNFSTTGGVTNISNLSSGFSTAGYGNFTAQSASQVAGQSIAFSTTIVGPTVGAAIWIDWNHDGVFQATERVASTTAYVSVFNGNILVPVTAMTGNTRMRVTVDFNIQTPSDPCLKTSGRREFEDYTFTVLPPQPCTGTPNAATIASSNASVCISGSVTLTATGYSTALTGISLQWYSVENGLIAGATGATYTTPVITSSSSYFVRVLCASGGSADSNIVTIAVNNPAIATTTAGSRCGTGSVNLSATTTDGSDVKWYSAASGGAPLFTGNNFATPVIAATTTYYAQAGFSTPKVAGITAPGASDGTFTTDDWGLVFDVVNPITLSSVDLYSAAAGTVNIKIMNAALTQELFSTGNVAIVAGGRTTPNVVPLNFTLPVGTGYRILIKDYAGIELYRGSAGISFPYTSPDLNITSSEWGGVTTTSYYFFYNMRYTAGCQASVRVPVIASVTDSPELSLSTNATAICVGQASDLITVTGAANYQTFVWSPASGVSGDAVSGFTFNPSATTNYTLTATTASGCTSILGLVVTVNAFPEATQLFASATTVCPSGAPVKLSLSTFQSLSPSLGSGVTTNSGTTYPTPYGAYYENVKHQYLVKASELTALGITAGPLTSISFDVALVGTSANHDNYTISIGNTSQNAIATWTNSLTQVFGPVSYQPIAGANTHVFSTPFVWDGTSNIVIQTCHTNDPSAGGFFYSNNAQVRNSTTPFNSTLSVRLDNIDACGSSTISATQAIRPNMVFGYNAMNVGVFTPTTGLFTDAAATTPYTGTSVSAVYAIPSVSTTYSATVTNSSNCSVTTNTVTIDVEPSFPYFVDADGDGFGSSVSVMLCTADGNSPPSGYSLISGDCDDTNVAVNPNATEILYNGIDDNCDGMIDEGNQITTQIKAAMCGTTLNQLYAIISANAVPMATSYRFKVETLGTTQVQYYVSVNPSFRITDLASYSYDMTYIISVEVQRNGVWLGYYGPTCRISTPSLANALTLKECGMTRNIFSPINAYVVQGATGYKFRVTNVSNPGGQYGVMEIETSVSWFHLTSLPSYEYNTTYSVQVAIKTTGDYTAYGPACDISTLPYSALNLSIKQCGVTYTNRYASINANVIPNVSGYRFRITNLATSVQQEISSAISWITLDQVSGYVAGASYSVEVAVKTTGDFGAYGPACTINTPAAIASNGTVVTADFKVVASPNPYTDTFAISLTSSADSQVEVRVYDMIGKLLEVRNVSASDVETQKLGTGYPSGVYNVIVTQNDVVKTLRVIKR